MHPHCAFVFRSIQAAYLSLIEPQGLLRCKHQDHLAKNHTSSGTSCLSTRTRIVSFRRERRRHHQQDQSSSNVVVARGLSMLPGEYTISWQDIAPIAHIKG